MPTTEEPSSPARPAVPLPAAEGLDAEAAATFCGVSMSKWRQLDADGHCPAPVNLGVGRCPRWAVSELRAWMLAGAPTRAAWVRVRDQSLRLYRSPV